MKFSLSVVNGVQLSNEKKRAAQETDDWFRMQPKKQRTEQGMIETFRVHLSSLVICKNMPVDLSACKYVTLIQY